MMPTIEIPVDTLRLLYEHYYNPATDYRDPPEITSAWRMIADMMGQCSCGEDDNKDPGKSLPHKTWCPKAWE